MAGRLAVLLEELAPASQEPGLPPPARRGGRCGRDGRVGARPARGGRGPPGGPGGGAPRPRHPRPRPAGARRAPGRAGRARGHRAQPPPRAPAGRDGRAGRRARRGGTHRRAPRRHAGRPGGKRSASASPPACSDAAGSSGWTGPPRSRRPRSPPGQRSGKPCGARTCGRPGAARGGLPVTTAGLGRWAGADQALAAAEAFRRLEPVVAVTFGARPAAAAARVAALAQLAGRPARVVVRADRARLDGADRPARAGARRDPGGDTGRRRSPRRRARGRVLAGRRVPGRRSLDPVLAPAPHRDPRGAARPGGPAGRSRVRCSPSSSRRPGGPVLPAAEPVRPHRGRDEPPGGEPPHRAPLPGP